MEVKVCLRTWSFPFQGELWSEEEELTCCILWSNRSSRLELPSVRCYGNNFLHIYRNTQVWVNAAVVNACPSAGSFGERMVKWSRDTKTEPEAFFHHLKTNSLIFLIIGVPAGSALQYIQTFPLGLFPGWALVGEGGAAGSSQGMHTGDAHPRSLGSVQVQRSYGWGVVCAHTQSHHTHTHSPV